MKVKEGYAVFLLQATGESLNIYEGTTFEATKAVFDKVEAELEKARKTKGALFKMRDPFIISCDPLFVVRLMLVPKREPVLTDSDNPYEKRMQKMGFGATMNNPTGQLLDTGYKPD